MIKLEICIICIIFIIIIIMILLNKRYTCVDNFENKVEKKDFADSSVFVHLYDNNKNKLNVVLISKPFATDKDYKYYLNNKHKYIYIGITSYMEFPGLPSNPLDDFKIEESFSNVYNINMYKDICEGWLHCFREPCNYIPCDKPNALISESDFVNTNILVPDKDNYNDNYKEYDFIYNCPKVNKDSSCNDWVSHNKNWELALKCLPILCEKFKLKGLLIGRSGCDIPTNCKPYITTTGWVKYEDVIKLYKKSKFLFLPNQRDASPRVITECMALDLPCIMNKNILGGWKYINNQTGVFFTDEKDLEKSLNIFLNNLNNYKPRRFILDNYGLINSGKRLKEFLFKNFKSRLNINNAEYIILRNPL